jgi:methionyl-tRNA synthetase
MSKEKITFDEFLDIESKLEIQIGSIDAAERIPKSKKLLKLTVNFGVGSPTRTVVTNLGENHSPEFFEGLHLPFITNLAPTTMMGVESEAMIMVGTHLNGGLDFSNHLVGTKLM